MVDYGAAGRARYMAAFFGNVNWEMVRETVRRGNRGQDSRESVATRQSRPGYRNARAHRGDTMPHPVLWQFRQSHYNDKARWALDFKRPPHVRRSLLPGLAHPARPLDDRARRRAGPGPERAARSPTRPVSSAALEEAYPDPPLYPRDAAGARACARARGVLRRAARSAHPPAPSSHDLLPHTDYAAALITTGFAPATRSV